MMKLGLTGGIGTGKTTVAEMFRSKGIPLIDTDDLARDFTRPGQPVLEKIVECFGREMLDEQGALRRGALAERVFQDAEARRRLEALLHPPIREAWRRQLDSWRAEGRTAGLVVIPLLYETNCETELDAIICTACSAATQRNRLHQRGWNDAQIDGRLAAQLPMKTKMERADFVIWCEGELAATKEQVEALRQRLGLRRAGGS